MRGELTDAIIAAVELRREISGRIVETIIESMTESLKRFEPVSIRDFGTFGVPRRKAAR